MNDPQINYPEIQSSAGAVAVGAVSCGAAIHPVTESPTNDFETNARGGLGLGMGFGGGAGGADIHPMTESPTNDFETNARGGLGLGMGFGGGPTQDMMLQMMTQGSSGEALMLQMMFQMQQQLQQQHQQFMQKMMQQQDMFQQQMIQKMQQYKNETERSKSKYDNQEEFKYDDDTDNFASTANFQPIRVKDLLAISQAMSIIKKTIQKHGKVAKNTEMQLVKAFGCNIELWSNPCKKKRDAKLVLKYLYDCGIRFDQNDMHLTLPEFQIKYQCDNSRHPKLNKDLAFIRRGGYNVGDWGTAEQVPDDLVIQLFPFSRI